MNTIEICGNIFKPRFWVDKINGVPALEVIPIGEGEEQPIRATFKAADDRWVEFTLGNWAFSGPDCSGGNDPDGPHYNTVLIRIEWGLCLPVDEI